MSETPIYDELNLSGINNELKGKIENLEVRSKALIRQVLDGSLTLNPPTNSYERVLQFHTKFDAPIGVISGKAPDKKRRKLRLKLIKEEFKELKQAVKKGDYVAIADALGDLEYVVNGMAIEYGINLPEVVEEIHRSNMTKLGPDGKPILRSDGKILKGESYEKPNLERVLFGE